MLKSGFRFIVVLIILLTIYEIKASEESDRYNVCVFNDTLDDTFVALHTIMLEPGESVVCNDLDINTVCWFGRIFNTYIDVNKNIESQKTVRKPVQLMLTEEGLWNYKVIQGGINEEQKIVNNTSSIIKISPYFKKLSGGESVTIEMQKGEVIERFGLVNHVISDPIQKAISELKLSKEELQKKTFQVSLYKRLFIIYERVHILNREK